MLFFWGVPLARGSRPDWAALQRSGRYATRLAVRSALRRRFKEPFHGTALRWLAAWSGALRHRSASLTRNTGLIGS
jgi:hypothetical protein